MWFFIYFRYVILRWINALHKFSSRSFTSMIGIAMNLQITLRETNVIILSLSIYEYCVSISCSCSVAKWCPTLCNPMDYSPPGPSVPGISQARILEWVAISFSRESSQLRDRPSSPALAGEFFNNEQLGKCISLFSYTMQHVIFMIFFTKGPTHLL